MPSQDPRFERGKEDAVRGYSPREGSGEYLRGYAENVRLVTVHSGGDELCPLCGVDPRN